jgi:glutamine amidotransferase
MIGDVTIIDYGLGNLLSVKRGFEHWGIKATITSDASSILNSKRIVLPGVGAFPRAMKLLEEKKLISVIREFGVSGRSILAICLGMQLLMENGNEFGSTQGLGLIAGNVIQIPNFTQNNERLKVPHIGWNQLKMSDNHTNWKGTLLEDIGPTDSAYFVHSYMVKLASQKDEISYASYGDNKITAAISKGPIHGCQFHPEKSGEVGLKILRRFCLD